MSTETASAISEIDDPDSIRVQLFINNKAVHAPLTDVVDKTVGSRYFPVGGTTGQFLAKASNADYDVIWSVAVTPDATQTLTNKTLTSPAISNPTITGTASITSTGAGTVLTVASTDADGGGGPDLVLDRNSASPATNDLLSFIIFRGRDSAANQQSYGQIYAQITDPTSGSEDGVLVFETPVAGTVAGRLTVGGGVYTPNATGGDKGADTFNASIVYAAGVKLGLTSGTSVASTSGTSIDFTGIPVGVKRVTVQFTSVSKSSTSDIMIQIGTSGGIESTSYAAGSCIIVAGSGSNATNYTTGFGMYSNSGNYFLSGIMTLELTDSATNAWVSSHTMGMAGSNAGCFGGGSKSLAGALDRVRITTVGGANTFDNGSINLMWE